MRIAVSPYSYAILDWAEVFRHPATTSLLTSAARVGLLQFVDGIDVAKSIGFVVEGYLDDIERRIPRIYLATAAFEKARKVCQHIPANQREDRMRLIERARDGKLRMALRECRGKTRH